MKKHILVGTIILICLLLAGCPSYIPQEDELKNGEFYREQITAYFSGAYRINFNKKNTPEVIINYTSFDQKDKSIKLKLDGFDTSNRIGYRFISLKDMKEWEQKDIEKIPDINDASIIQERALNYEYPILFIWIPEGLWEDYNSNLFFSEIESILKTKEMRNWLKDLLYDGEVIKKGIEDKLAKIGINLQRRVAPTVNIKYGANKYAIFKLDGYDEKRRIGYKFVTAEDIETWKVQREAGGLEVPDLTDAEQIKEAALTYEFPVFFIYIPQYWELDISVIIDSQFSEALYMNEHIVQWLKEH